MQNTRSTLANALSSDAAAPKPTRERDHAAEDATRTTAQVKLRMRQEVLDIVDDAASKANLNRSEYVTHLILGQPIVPTPAFDKASDTILLTLAGHRVMQAIAACQARLKEGETSETLAELQAIRREIVRGHLSLKDDYEKRLDARSKKGETWADKEAK